MEEKILKNLATKSDLEETNELIKANAKTIDRNAKTTDGNAKAIDRNAKAIDGNTKAISKIDHLLETTARQVVKNGEVIKRTSLVTVNNAAKIKGLPIREEIDVKFSKVFDGQDKIIEKLDSLETEKTASIVREARVDKEIKNIKEHLAIA